MRRLPLLLLAVFLLSAAKPPAAEKMLNLMERLGRAEQSRAAGKPERVTFDLTESDVNDYLVWSLRETPRPGLESLRVKFFPNNYVSSFTVVDFDAVERWKPGTIPVMLRPVLTGKRSIWVDLRFRSSGGHATYTVEKAYFDRIPLPPFFVDKVIAVVAAQQPEHYDTSKPIPLGFGIQRVWTGAQTLSGET